MLLGNNRWDRLARKGKWGARVRGERASATEKLLEEDICKVGESLFGSVSVSGEREGVSFPERQVDGAN